MSFFSAVDIISVYVAESVRCDSIDIKKFDSVSIDSQTTFVAPLHPPSV